MTSILHVFFQVRNFTPGFLNSAPENLAPENRKTAPEIMRDCRLPVEDPSVQEPFFLQTRI